MRSPFRPLRLAGLLSLLGAASVSAATITVTSAADSGAGSLRAAIASAQATGDTIDFALAPGATIQLSSELTVATKDLVIRGPGASQLTVRGAGGGQRVFTFVRRTFGSTLSGLTVTNGATTGNNFGGGISLAGGWLTVTGCVITGNSAAVGGGIHAVGGTRLKLIDCVVSNNAATGVGGGIAGNAGGSDAVTITLVRTTVSGNTSSVDGAGIWAAPPNSGSSAALHLIQSRVTGNTSTTGFGGGILANGPFTMQGGSVDANTSRARGGGLHLSGAATLTDAAVRGNTAIGASNDSRGGGIFVNTGGSLILLRCAVTSNKTTGSGTSNVGGGGILVLGALSATNCTVSGNSIDAGPGSGIALITGTVALDSCTIAFNVATATNAGAALYNAAAAAAFTCRNSIVAKSVGGLSSGGGAPFDVFGPFTSGGFNLVGSNANGSGFGGSGLTSTDQVGTSAAPLDPRLEPLADNGGPTLTHALQAGSPALDAGDIESNLATDQRGFPRCTPSAGTTPLAARDTSDIGAFESGNTALRVTSVVRPADGSVVIQGVGLPNALHTVQAAPHMNSGFTALLPIFSDASGNLVFQDEDAATFAERFYRFTYP